MKDLDLIIVWPTHVDYPLWREFLLKNRQRFNKVIVSFANMNAGDISNLIRTYLAKLEVIFIEPKQVRADQDWRSVAVNRALEFSKSEWVWFTEQDFIITNPIFWEIAEHNIENRNLDAFIYSEGNRPHPSCWFVKRSLVDKTSRDFGVVRDKSDHFSIFFEELNKIANIGTFSKRPDFYHLNGLSQNMYLLQSGQQPNFRVDEFKNYLRECLALSVPISDDMRKMIVSYVG